MSTVRVALALAMGERYILILMALASNVLLARLLTPEQIGIFAVSLAVIAVAQVFRDFGVGSYLIQERDLTDSHVRTAFGTTLVLGLALFFMVWFGAAWGAQIYNEPRIAATLRVCSLNFLVLPFCTVSLALLRRDMKFQQLAIVGVSSTAVGSLVTIVCAFHGLGEISMAIGSVATNVSTGLGAWIASPRRGLFSPSFSQWRTVLRFGGQSSVSGVITSVSMDANDLFVAKILGFHEAAMLSRAQGLMSLLNRDVMAAVRGVALPVFASAYRKQENVAAQHRKSIAIATVFAWPLYGLLALYSLEALRLLYGHQWDAARLPLVVFCAAGAVMTVTALSPTLLTAVGRIDLTMRFDLVMQPLRLLLIVAAAFYFKSILACAVALLVVACISVPCFLWFRRIALPGEVAPTTSAIAASFTVSLVSLIPALGHSYVVGFERVEPVSIWSIVLIVVASVFLWVGAAVAVCHPVAEERMFIRLVGRAGRWWRMVWRD